MCALDYGVITVLLIGLITGLVTKKENYWRKYTITLMLAVAIYFIEWLLK